MGVGLFGIFAPIYFFHIYHHRIDWLIISVIVQYVIDLLLSPIAAMAMTRWGIKKSMVVGTILFALYLLLMASQSWFSFWTFVIGTMIVGCLYHVLYWLPYHMEFVLVTPGKKRGEIIGAMSAMASLIGVVTPIVGGFIIASSGYATVMFLAFLCIALALPSLYWVKAAQERFVFSFTQTWRVLFSKPYRSFLAVYMAEGAETIVGLLFWPLFLYDMSRGDYVSVGLNSGLIVAFTIVLELVIGYLSDHQKSARLLKTGIGLSSLGWIAKACVTSLSQAVLAGVFHSFSLILMRVPFQAKMYALAADAGHYIDEYTVLREMALCLGRIVMLVLCLLTMTFLGFASGFVLAAIATIGFVYIIKLPFERHTMKASASSLSLSG